MMLHPCTSVQFAALAAAAAAAAGSSSSPCVSGPQGSECTMVCNDFARLGYDNVVVDAGVQLTYDWDLAREMSGGELLLICNGRACTALLAFTTNQILAAGAHGCIPRCVS